MVGVGVAHATKSAVMHNAKAASLSSPPEKEPMRASITRAARREVALKATQKCENNPIRMMIGIGIPMSQSSAERMVNSVFIRLWSRDGFVEC